MCACLQTAQEDRNRQRIDIAKSESTLKCGRPVRPQILVASGNLSQRPITVRFSSNINDADNSEIAQPKQLVTTTHKLSATKENHWKGDMATHLSAPTTVSYGAKIHFRLSN